MLQNIQYRTVYYGYDEFNRLSTYYEGAKENPATSERIAYTYNDRDNISKVTYPNNLGIKSVSYEYDSKNRLTQIRAITDSNSTPKTVREYTYSPKGNVKTIKDYAGFNYSNNKYILKTYTYDKYDHVTKMSYANSEDLTIPVEEYNFTYNKNGNIITEDIYNNYIANNQINELKEYTYDNLGRLINVKVTDRANDNKVTNTSYTYDKVGNRLTKTKNEATESYEYNNLNELLNVKNGTDVIKTYTYDANGNTIKEVSGEETINYSYNINNQMTKYENSNGIVEENEYNIDEQRVKKVVTSGNNSKESNYYYDSGNLLYTTDNNNKMTSSNILNIDGNVISSARKNSNYLYFFTYNKDCRNSTSSIVDFTNKALVAYKYDEFGETEEVAGISTTADYPAPDDDEYDYKLNSIDNEICYTGGIYDKETGEYYLNARHYDPSIARFTTVDTYRGESNQPLTLNTYSYCENNPTNYIDPSGHKKKFVGFGFQIAFSASGKFLNANMGAEIVWYNGKLTQSSPYFYIFVEGGFFTSYEHEASKKIYNRMKKRKNKLLKAKKISADASGSVFVVYDKKGKAPNADKYAGSCTTNSISWLGKKGYIANGSRYKCYGAGISLNKSFLIQWSYTTSYYKRFVGWGDFFYSLKRSIRKKTRKVDKKLKKHFGSK